LRQGELGLVRSARGIASAAVETGQSLVVYRSPLTKGTPDFDWLRNLDGIARRRHLAPMLYKCAPQHAAVARRYGWAVMRVSDEAVLSPATFNATIPACRQLRRMLRKATSAGVTVTSAGRRLPIAEMTAVSANWVRENGHERGVFMGRFHPDVLLAQRVFLAYRDARLVGFVSFNEVAAEWSLDLMRQSPDAPDGTIHLLVTEAIAQAAACGAPRLSLASVPRDRAFDTWLPAFVQSRLSVATGAPGLRQFKSCFAPVWEPLYAAAPTRFGLVWGLAEVARAINRPKRR
jgi:phosphatidylglycerol lysyltransferase